MKFLFFSAQYPPCEPFPYPPGLELPFVISSLSGTFNTSPDGEINGVASLQADVQPLRHCGCCVRSNWENLLASPEFDAAAFLQSVRRLHAHMTGGDPKTARHIDVEAAIGGETRKYAVDSRWHGEWNAVPIATLSIWYYHEGNPDVATDPDVAQNIAEILRIARDAFVSKDESL